MLVGLTPLIPVPFVDDLVRGHLMRRMVRALAAERGRALSNEEVQALTEDRGGCLAGCAGQFVVWPKGVRHRLWTEGTTMTTLMFERHGH